MNHIPRNVAGDNIVLNSTTCPQLAATLSRRNARARKRDAYIHFSAYVRSLYAMSRDTKGGMRGEGDEGWKWPSHGSGRGRRTGRFLGSVFGSSEKRKRYPREGRSTIFRSYSRVLCNRRPMHLAGQSFMAEPRTRKNVCFNSLPLPPPFQPARLPAS